MAKGPAKQTDETPEPGPDLETAATKALVAASAAEHLDGALAVELSKGDLDVQIATAKAYPRQMGKAIRAVIELATTDGETAQECIYSLPRDGKLITGPSIRLAELLFQQWGNNRLSAYIENVDRQTGFIVAVAAYHDLETNSALRRSIRRGIRNKNGVIFNADMITVTGNAASAIAMRNAILAGIPKPVWRQAYVKCLAIIKGDERTLGERRLKLLAALSELGLANSQIFQIAGISGVVDITMDKMVELSGLYTALKNGETTLDDLLGRTAPMTRDLSQATGAPAPGKAAAEPSKSENNPKQSETIAKNGEKPVSGAATGVAAASAQAEATSGPQAQEEPATAANAAEGPQQVDAFALAVAEGAEEPGETAKQETPIEALSWIIRQGEDWEGVRSAMMQVRQNPLFTPEMVMDLNRVAYDHTCDLVASEKTLVDPSSDVQFFTLWLAFAAKPDNVRLMYQRLIRWEGYKNMPEAARNGLATAVMDKEAETQ